MSEYEGHSSVRNQDYSLCMKIKFLNRFDSMNQSGIDTGRSLIPSGCTYICTFLTEFNKLPFSLEQVEFARARRFPTR